MALGPGETKSVSVTLEARAFAFWDQDKQTWAVEAGTYEVVAAASSADVRAKTKVDVAARSIAP